MPPPPRKSSRKKQTASDFFNKTIKCLMSILQFHGGHTTSSRPPGNPFSSCSSRKLGKDVSIKQVYYSDDRWMMDEFGQGNSTITNEDKGIIMTNNECLNKHEQRANEKSRIAREEGCFKKQGSSRISQRMKELEMMEFKDVDHVLDVEEVLHYYSRLRSPVYLDIVDTFFTDMYAELHKPQGTYASFHGDSTQRSYPYE